MSKFTDLIYGTAATTATGLVAGEPDDLTRRTWGEVHRQARRIAGALAANGIGPGAKVCVLAGKPSEIIPLVQAMWMRGAALTMLHQPTPRTDLAVWLTETAEVLKMVEADAVVLSDPFGDLSAGLSIPALRYADLVDGPDTDPLDPAEDDNIVLQLSSGSTGTPKAIVITHRNMYTCVRDMQERYELTRNGIPQPGEVMVSWVPLFHDMGMIGFLGMSMSAGIELVQVTPADFLRNPLLWAELISTYRGTLVAAPNFAYSLLGARLDRVTDTDTYDLSCVRYAINAAEPINCDAMDLFLARTARFGFPAEALVGAYGLAENVLTTCAPFVGTGLLTEEVDPAALEEDNVALPMPAGRRLAKLGPPLPSTEVRIVDPNGTPLGTRRVGEFEIRGDAVTSTFVTAKGTIPAQDSEGWLATGDLGYRTETGDLVVCGRKKDLIIISGRNLYPTDIERAVEQVDGVRTGNTVAVPLAAGTSDEGFAVLAESTLHQDNTQVQELRRTISTHVFKAVGIAPRTITILPPGSIPKTPSGKVRRTQARTLIA